MGKKKVGAWHVTVCGTPIQARRIRKLKPLLVFAFERKEDLVRKPTRRRTQRRRVSNSSDSLSYSFPFLERALHSVAVYVLWRPAWGGCCLYCRPRCCFVFSAVVLPSPCHHVLLSGVALRARSGTREERDCAPQTKRRMKLQASLRLYVLVRFERNRPLYQRD